MVSKCFQAVLCLCLLIHGFSSANGGGNSNSSTFTAMEIPSFNAAAAADESDCSFPKPNSDKTLLLDDGVVKVDDFKVRPTVVLNMKHRHVGAKPADCVAESTAKDLNRIQTFQTRITEKKNQNLPSRIKKNGDRRRSPQSAAAPEVSSGGGGGGKLVATLESGVSLGSGEYFMDVFIGTPPKHFSLILDTGSDLNWIQCVPCLDCFEQNGAFYDPNESTSYRNVSCDDPLCKLVSSPEPPQACRGGNQSCPYYYWYGDSSNTTGDFALETFTVNMTSFSKDLEFRKVENVMFGCGHWNRGLFHGAAGLLGLGRGPLSFASQLQSLYGHSFSYCLVDRNSNASVSSKLIFGEDEELLRHPELNFTALLGGRENPVDTFYYVGIRSIVVEGEVLGIPEETWGLSPDGSGGTIIDSGTTLSYFAEPAYRMIKEAIVERMSRYPVVEDFPILDPCYNVSGVEEPYLPSFGIVFMDGAVWNFPPGNYFIRLDPDDIVCLAILGTPRSGLSIIGNYQQQNFHILYDTKESRLGFAPTKCAEM
ncbi:aspartyl protease family protein 2-like [Salvia miltiorrhiza]|uniref:aspartyl protease family protein 2-like n=1 Tax=Salvia miltiorrhiza TaxID=226208 RepID=UPI0025AD38BD|nr:aspartyl protease family protein 2-like [Salvia miltiorrhiza]